MTGHPYTNYGFDSGLYLSKIAKRQPSSRYQQEQNFIGLFRQAGIERMMHEANLAFWRSRHEFGSGI